MAAVQELFCRTKAKRRNYENCNFTGEAKNELSST